MTKEVAIEILEKEKAYMIAHGGDRQAEALTSAIKALEQEPKTGHWRPIYQGDEIIGYRCSECEFGRTEKIYRANYCHNCGAKMKSEG